MENNSDILQQISKKLSILIALQLQGESGIEVKENVAKLIRFDLTTPEIAEILGTTSGTVQVAKARIKKSKSK
jgi:DNA-binding CsgD family transcriptional regulator